MDAQHRDFLEKVARAARLVDSGETAAVAPAIAAAVGSLKAHFAAEEALFSDTSYTHAAEHEIEHRVLLHLAAHINKTAIRLADPVVLKLALRHLAQAAVEHFVQLDLDYRPFLAGSDT
jgi:hemerythrin-like metal-binding protein